MLEKRQTNKDIIKMIIMLTTYSLFIELNRTKNFIISLLPETLSKGFI